MKRIPLPIHGRGASYDPPNRFETLHYERDEWTDEGDPSPQARFYRDHTKDIIATNDSPDVGLDASINPYRGCEHGCSYCMAGETPILMGDGTTRALADIRVGDGVYGTVREGWYRRYKRTAVLAHWSTRKQAYRVILADGAELIASGDHRFLTLRGWKFITGTESGRTRRPHLTTNDSLLGTGAFTPSPSASEAYRLGYLCGMIRGDGMLQPKHPGGLERPHRFRHALIDDAGLQRSARYLGSFGVKTRFRVFRVATESRKELRAISTSGRDGVARIHDLIAWRRNPPADWHSGFLAGIFDAEGSSSDGVLRISNTSFVIIEITRRSLHRLGFDCVVERRTYDGRLPVTNLRVRGGLQGHLRFFHTTNPAIVRKRDIQGTALESQADLRVVAIEPLGKRELFDITTGTGDFIANGVVSHNCYARPTHEYLGFSAGLDFETKILVKPDAASLLRRRLASPRWKPRPIMLSGNTDPYQPAERRLRITRGVLEVLAEFRNPVAIITKNHLVTRDLDLLTELAAHDAVGVTLSVTSLRNEIQRVMEPRTSVPKRRLDAIRTLARAGVPVGVNVAPVIPGLTDQELPAILEAAAEAGATTAAYIVVRLPHGVKELFETWLGQHFPERKDKVLGRLRELHDGKLYDSTWSHRKRGEGPYAEQIRGLFEVASRRAGLNGPGSPLSTAAFRRMSATGQTDLFG
jgi:DNA repair photolyase